MGLRFSDDGPEFPVALVDAVLEGKAIFLCGAGVSAPQLPGFADLVDRVYLKLGMEPTAAEAAAMKAGRFEEALGSVARQLSDRSRMHTVIRRLLTLKSADLTNHKILLRLSRGLDNRIALVTTNFDTLFERAIEDIEGPGRAKINSLAGQALAPPGSEDFAGVIHLHGRTADPDLNLEDSPLVLTSAEYGEAYMRSGWASRFLFDLVRCRTLVLVGYRAGDAPVRYFLNVLEADRERFSDLNDVYALDLETENAEALARWAALAVTPLGYKPGRGTGRHGALWRDLGRLAELADKPKAWRRERAATILAEPLDAQTSAQLAIINWIFDGKRDVWDVAITAIQDPRWFDHFFSQKLLTDADASWVLAAWCALDWTSRARLDAAVTWHNRLGRGLGESLEHRLSSAPPTDPLWLKAWSLVARGAPRLIDRSLQAYRVGRRIRKGPRIDADLVAGVRLLRPRLDIQERYRAVSGDSETPRSPQRLSDLLFVRLRVDDRGGVPEIDGALRSAADATERLIQIATEELRVTVALAREAELIGEGWDNLDAAVQTVENHPQNEFRDGVTHLVELLTDLLSVLVKSDPAAARVWAEAWRSLPSRLGVRLWLQALRHTEIYTADEVAEDLLRLPADDFWSIRRELILAMAERLGQANAVLVARLTERIIAEAPSRYENLTLIGSGNDWRPQVRDRDKWLRLGALRRAGVLPEIGVAELEAIAERHPFISGDYGEADLFSSYSTGVRYIAGDAKTLQEADPESRLEVAHKLSNDWDPDTRLDWSAYCSADPMGALEALRQGDFADPAGPLWNDLIGALAWGAPSDDVTVKDRRSSAVQGVFDHLMVAPDDFIDRVAARLADLWPRASLQGNEQLWWDRIWSALERTIERDEDLSPDGFYDRVINNPAGRMAEHLVAAVNRAKTKTRRIGGADRERLRWIMSSQTEAGWFGRGALVRDAGFILFVDRAGTLQHLRPKIAAEDAQGAALRAVLLEDARLGRVASKVFRREVMVGVAESTATGQRATHVASKILIPLLQQQLAAVDGKASDWGLTVDDARRLLKKASPSIREGAAHVFKVWVTPTDMTPEAAWQKAVGPVFDEVWPKERQFKSASHAHDLAAMCVRAGKKFSEAFNMVRHFLTPFETEWANLVFLSEGKAAAQYPETTLDLLWAICGPGFPGQSDELGKILGVLGKARPSLVLDRRFQWLEQRVITYG